MDCKFLLSAGVSLVTIFLFSCSSSGGIEDKSSSSSVIACSGIEYNPYSHYCFEGEIIAKGEITDARDGKVYKVVTIYNQTWMAENLNYNVSGSRCYDDEPVNCEIYGRLYEWKLAMGACPQGWHLPSEDEWRELLTMVWVNNLRSINYWRYSEEHEKTDSYGFSALPGGVKWPDHWGSELFHDIGIYGIWWHSSVFDGYDTGSTISIRPNSMKFSEIGAPLGYMVSVRCVE